MLFSVIDSVGSLPFIIHIKRNEGSFNNLKVTVIAGVLMIIFLLTGDKLLYLMGLDIASFAMAGATIMFLSSVEMILGVKLYKGDTRESSNAIVPLAFPMLAGAGTLTSLLSLRSLYTIPEVMIALLINVGIIYLVLLSSGWIERKLGNSGVILIRKVFGIVVLAMAFKIFTASLSEFLS